MRRMRAWFTALGTAVLTIAGLIMPAPVFAAPATLRPGVLWYDTAGNRLQAHGAGVFKVGSTYYMVGEDKTAGATFTAVACYSSTDLATWTRQGNALSRQSSGDLAAGRIVERPKVIYNSSTGQYVMWVHIDNSSYGDARAGVATSPTPCGPYTYRGSSRPLGFESRDLGLFKDDDGTAYLLTEDRAHGLRIDRLSADYTQAVSTTAVLADLESPAMVKVNGRYFLFASHLTGWSTNDNAYATATSLSGPWSGFTTFAPNGSRTFDSQTSSVVPVTGSSGTTYVYVGDRWNPNDLNSSTPVWLPLSISGSTASMSAFYDSWTIDTATGTWAATQTPQQSFTLVGAQSGRCLDVAGGAANNGSTLQIYDCNGGAGQKWSLTSSGELRTFGGTKCLDVFDQRTTAGAPVGIWDCNGGANQRWTVNSSGTVVGVQSGLCLDVNGNQTANGTKVQMWTCNGGSNQRWTRT
ncbi:lectin [Microbispora sp. H10670]|uniref:lectin n=1 Tax=Microbispora sp. H10670 TaxID=2729108 RepID=UPI0015FF3200|nr:lectin [Microbispora sp. H10670]